MLKTFDFIYNYDICMVRLHTSDICFWLEEDINIDNKFIILLVKVLTAGIYDEVKGELWWKENDDDEATRCTDELNSM